MKQPSAKLDRPFSRGSRQPKSNGFGAYAVAVTAVLVVALLSGGSAFALTLLAPSDNAERYVTLAALFMETWKMAVVALLGLLAGNGLR
jgi:hypothetical protein